MKTIAAIIAGVLLLAGCGVAPDPYCPGGKVIISPFDCPSGRCVIFDMPVRSQAQYDELVKQAASRPATQPTSGPALPVGRE